MTQEQLGRLIGVCGRAVGHYEANTRFPDKNALYKLADIFNVSVDYLLGRTNDRRPSIITTDQVHEAITHQVVPADSPRVLEIARQLKKITTCPEILDNILVYARFLAERERQHPGPHTPGPVATDEHLPKSNKNSDE